MITKESTNISKNSKLTQPSGKRNQTVYFNKL